MGALTAVHGGRRRWAADRAGGDALAAPEPEHCFLGCCHCGPPPTGETARRKARAAAASTDVPPKLARFPRCNRFCCGGWLPMRSCRCARLICYADSSVLQDCLATDRGVPPCRAATLTLPPLVPRRAAGWLGDPGAFQSILLNAPAASNPTGSPAGPGHRMPAPTCARYSFTYCSARLKISLRAAVAFCLASAAAPAFLAAQSSSRFRFLRTAPGSGGMDACIDALLARPTSPCMAAQCLHPALRTALRDHGRHLASRRDSSWDGAGSAQEAGAGGAQGLHRGGRSIAQHAAVPAAYGRIAMRAALTSLSTGITTFFGPAQRRSCPSLAALHLASPPGAPAASYLHSRAVLVA